MQVGLLGLLVWATGWASIFRGLRACAKTGAWPPYVAFNVVA